uniref:Secreted protein n=1 Tax=Oryza sativa subsp. japonica TaxID=39947 RepID=Q84TW7_ORYSJ|nr:hypothetical protein [Oryza sativa Japonica Group]
MDRLVFLLGVAWDGRLACCAAMASSCRMPRFRACINYGESQEEEEIRRDNIARDNLALNFDG